MGLLINLQSNNQSNRAYHPCTTNQFLCGGDLQGDLRLARGVEILVALSKMQLNCGALSGKACLCKLSDHQMFGWNENCSQIVQLPFNSVKLLLHLVELLLDLS